MTATTSSHVIDPLDEKVDMLVSMMGDADRDFARKVLQYFDGDIDKAADALLGGQAHTLDLSAPPGNLEGYTDYSQPAPPPSPNKVVVDLTKDDTVPPKQEWALVRSNVPVNQTAGSNMDVDVSQDEQLNKAIAESLAMSATVDEVEEAIPPEDWVRKDNRPVILRTTDPKFAHIGQLWQAFYHVPQVRYRISRYRGPTPPEGATEVDPPTSGIEGQVWSVNELFGYMELSILAIHTGESSINQFPYRPWEGISPRDDIEKAFTDFADRVEFCLDGSLATRHPDRPRLFHSQVKNLKPESNEYKDFSLFSVRYNDEDGLNDLVGCLSNQIFPKFPKRGSLNAGPAAILELAITTTADVVAFAPVRDESLPSYQDTVTGRPQRRKFSFPEFFYLDQFLMTNHERARGIIQNANVAEEEIQRLIKKKSEFTKLDEKDVMKSIRSSLYYYESVANSSTDVERKAEIGDSAAKLKTIITHIEGELEAITTTIERLKKDTSNLFSAKEFQQKKYDLRAVLMHDGLKGRKHVYSYINHDDAWWKIVDYTATKVTLETVLNDKDGMHLGAGPILLVYSRSLPEPLVSNWPDVVKVGARTDSSGFLEKFPRSIQETAYNPSAHIALDPKQTATLQQTDPSNASPEVTQIPLVPNRGPTS